MGAIPLSNKNKLLTQKETTFFESTHRARKLLGSGKRNGGALLWNTVLKELNITKFI
jgi:hypothetical protein